jgi:hypothetical protein
MINWTIFYASSISYCLFYTYVNTHKRNYSRRKLLAQRQKYFIKETLFTSRTDKKEYIISPFPIENIYSRFAFDKKILFICKRICLFGSVKKAKKI